MITSLPLYSQKYFGFLLLIIFLGSFLGACDPEEPCASQATSTLQVGFYVPGEEDEIEQEFFYFNEVTALGAGNPFFDLEENSGANGLRLSLNPNADTTTFVFSYEENRKDTLQLTYQRGSRMISPDCGLNIQFSNIVMTKVPFTTDEEISVDLLSTELSATNIGFDLQIVSSKECEPQAVEDRQIRLGFYRMNESGEKEPDQMTFPIISPLINDDNFGGQEPRSEFLIELDPEEDFITYQFQENPQSIDTITIRYERWVKVESAFCLPNIYYKDIEVDVPAHYDSLSVIHPYLPVDTDPQTDLVNVELYK